MMYCVSSPETHEERSPSASCGAVGATDSGERDLSQAVGSQTALASMAPVRSMPASRALAPALTTTVGRAASARPAANCSAMSLTRLAGVASSMGT